MTEQERKAQDMLTEERWLKVLRKNLLGKKIVKVMYLPKDVTEEIGWYKRPPLIQFDDGSFLYPQMDDEGNEGGALYYQKGDKGETLPVL